MSPIYFIDMANLISSDLQSNGYTLNSTKCSSFIKKQLHDVLDFFSSFYRRLHTATILGSSATLHANYEDIVTPHNLIT